MIDRTRKFIFLHIPKTGGSSIETMLLGSDKVGDHGKLDREVLKTEPFAPYFPLMRHATLSEYEKLLSNEQAWLDDFKCFTLIRDPQDLLRSAYRFRIKNFELRKEITTPLKTAQFRIEHFSFTTFLMIQMVRSKFRQGHFRPLGEFTKNESGVDVRIFRLEDLSLDCSALSSFLQLDEDLQLPHKNPSQSKTAKSSPLLRMAAGIVFPEMAKQYRS